MNIPCANFSPCPDVYPPYTNLSSEDPDRYVCIGRSWGNYQSPPRLGSQWREATCYQTCELSLSDIDLIQCRALGKDMCSGECVQSVSQELADQCAANLSQCGDQCDTTGRACFYNTTQVCTVTCPDGTEFSYTVNAGTFSASSVDIANNQAYSFACQQANALRHCAVEPPNKICHITSGSILPGGYTSISYSFQIAGSASGTSNIFSIYAGSLPPGLTMNATGHITGTPTTIGNYSFSVRLTGSGISCTKDFSLSIASGCPVPATLTMQAGFIAAVNAIVNSLGQPSHLTGTFVLTNSACGFLEYMMTDPMEPNNTCTLNLVYGGGKFAWNMAFGWDPNIGIHGGWVGAAIGTLTPASSTNPVGDYLMGSTPVIPGYPIGSLISVT